jgi:energy-coupling factor transport system permease protein
LPPALVAHGVRGVVWLLLFVLVANLGWDWVARRMPGWAGGEPAAAASPGGLVLLVARLFELVLLSLVVTATTVPVDAAEAVERVFRPLARFRVPVHEIGPLLVLSLCFVPLFAREARWLADAQRLRTGRTRRTVASRIAALAPLVVPLFLGVVRRADELAIALDARCFVAGAPRTSLVPGRWGKAESITVAGAMAIAVAGARL